MEPTDSKDAPSDDKEAPGEAETPEVKVPEPAPKPARARSGGAIFLALLAIVLAAGLAALNWYDTRARVDATQAELARRLSDIETQGGDARTQAEQARTQAQQAQASVRELQTRLAKMDSSIAQLQSQKLELDSMYTDLTRNREELQLAEIEQVLSIASQQLQLSGNVHAALLALQFADQQLARADNPRFLPVRRAIAHDITRLSAVPALDVPGLSLRIDGVVSAVDGLPLAYEERAKPVPAAAAAAASGTEGFLKRLGSQVWRELRKLVVLRKVESPEPPLLPPSQTYFLRQNLKLRLLNARLSLLMRDEAGYRGDLKAAQTWLRQYFDTHSKRVGEVLAQLEKLSSISLDIEVPSISESLDAVRGLKARREGGS
jgi:uroporphyrin-3 C-methyltransferase